MTYPLNDESGRRSWPTGHSGWLFSDRADFEGCATSFLAQGAMRHERLIFIADDPRSRSWPQYLIEQGWLLIASTKEIYGTARIVDPASQRATFQGALADALREGYMGIRVVADNTSLVASPDRLAAWLRWEPEADRFARENPVTGMCAFNRSRLDAPLTSVLARLHRVTVSSDRERWRPTRGSTD